VLQGGDDEGKRGKREWCGVMEGGGSGGYSFSFMSGCLCTWVVIVICGWLPSNVGGRSHVWGVTLFKLLLMPH
jgi:hypothetical protein